jgi:hypothetical protein
MQRAMLPDSSRPPAGNHSPVQTMAALSYIYMGGNFWILEKFKKNRVVLKKGQRNVKKQTGKIKFKRMTKINFYRV